MRQKFVLFILSIFLLLDGRANSSGEKNPRLHTGRLPAGSPPDLIWATQLATHRKPDNDAAVAAVVDRDGNSYIVGTNIGLGTFNDFLAVKVDTSGNIAWALRHDGPLHWRDDATGIAVDSFGNTFISGMQNGEDNTLELTAVKINSTGVKEWVRSFQHHGLMFYGTRIAADRAGSVCVAGLDFLWSSGTFQATVASYTTSGVARWHRVLNNCAHFSDLVTDSENSFYLIADSGPVGSVIIKFDSTGAIVWQKQTAKIYDAVVDSNDNLFVTGGTTRDFTSLLYSAKLNKGGVILWQDSLLSPTASSGRSLALDRAEGVIVAGVTVNGTSNFITVRYDSVGHRAYTQTYAGLATNISSSTAIGINNLGAAFVCAATPYNCALLRIAGDGSLLGTTSLPGAIPLGAGFDTHDRFHIAGGFYDSITQNADYAVATISTNGTLDRMVRYEDNDNSYDGAGGFAFDSEHCIYVGGHSRLDDFSSLTLWKVDPLGRLLYQTHVTDSTNSIARCKAIARDHLDNTVLLGSITDASSGSDYYIAKINAAGRALWSRRYAHIPGVYYEDPSCMALDESGNIYVSGTHGPSSNENFLTVKFSPEGNVLWSCTFDGPAHRADRSAAIRIGKNGSVFVGGTSVGSDWRSDIAVVCYDHAGQELWNRRFDTLNTRDESVSTILLDDSSNVYCIGAAEGGRGSISRPSDSFLAKLSAEGDFCWSSRLDTTASDYFLRGSFTSDGNLLCVGVSRQTSYDFAMAKYTSSGRYLWSRTPNSYPSQYGDVPVDFALDSFGNAYLLGYTYVAADTRDICLSAHSSNGVPSWSSFYEGLYYGDDSPNAIALDDSNNVYVLETNSYGNGEYSVVNVLKIRVPMPTSAQSSAFLPSGLDLHQNYPNPFNPTTEIRYQIPEVGGRRSEVGHMTLKVYDLLGREVATLVNEVQQPGEHSVRFDAANLSSGVYLYRLVAGGYMQTRKMIVAK